MTKLTAIVVSVFDGAILLFAIVLDIVSNDLSTILMADLLACAGCLLAIPLLHFWIEDYPRRQAARVVTDEGIRRLEKRGASPELLAAARSAQTPRTPERTSDV